MARADLLPSKEDEIAKNREKILSSRSFVFCMRTGTVVRSVFMMLTHCPPVIIVHESCFFRKTCTMFAKTPPADRRRRLAVYF